MSRRCLSEKEKTRKQKGNTRRCFLFVYGKTVGEYLCVVSAEAVHNDESLTLSFENAIREAGLAVVNMPQKMQEDITF